MLGPVAGGRRRGREASSRNGIRIHRHHRHQNSLHGEERLDVELSRLPVLKEANNGISCRSERCSLAIRQASRREDRVDGCERIGFFR